MANFEWRHTHIYKISLAVFPFSQIGNSWNCCKVRDATRMHVRKVEIQPTYTRRCEDVRLSAKKYYYYERVRRTPKCSGYRHRHGLPYEYSSVSVYMCNDTNSPLQKTFATHNFCVEPNYRTKKTLDRRRPEREMEANFKFTMFYLEKRFYIVESLLTTSTRTFDKHKHPHSRNKVERRCTEPNRRRVTAAP